MFISNGGHAVIITCRPI